MLGTRGACQFLTNGHSMSLLTSVLCKRTTFSKSPFLYIQLCRSTSHISLRRQQTCVSTLLTKNLSANSQIKYLLPTSASTVSVTLARRLKSEGVPSVSPLAPGLEQENSKEVKKPETTLSRVKKYFWRLYDAYERFLERRFPLIYKYHRIFVDGSKLVLVDVKTYYRLKKQLWNGAKLTDLTEAEIIVYLQCGGLQFAYLLSLMFLLDILIIGDFIFLLAILAPNWVLTPHFWTNPQREKYWSQILQRKRRRHFSWIGQHIATPKYVAARCNVPASVKMLSFTTLSEQDFTNIDALSLWHTFHLCRVHSVLPVFGAKRRLKRRAELLHALDVRFNIHLIDTLTPLQLQFELYLRWDWELYGAWRRLGYCTVGSRIVTLCQYFFARSFRVHFLIPVLPTVTF